MARFQPEFLDELRARLPVSEVVSRRVKLKKAGREWKGLSPFQNEKTPSFTVNDQKGFYHCFSSGRHGDVISFVMETEGCQFAEAVERLAVLAGLPLPRASNEDAERAGRLARLRKLMEAAAAFYADALRSPAGAAAREYLQGRGIKGPDVARFRLGAAVGGRASLRDHLAAAHGATIAEMAEAGLIIAGEGIADPYDRFRDRLMFPIADARGRVIAFGGRTLGQSRAAKYINSPETPLFKKGAVLYNVEAARAAAHAGSPVIVAEGYVDVIALSAAGFPGAVAPMGTALTELQLSALWRMADAPVVCLDGDKAGIAAAHRVADLALPLLKPGKSLAFALMPAGQDPDDVARAGGREAVAALISGAVPLIETIWRREVEAAHLETPEGRAAFEAGILAIPGKIADEAVARHYRVELSAMLRALARSGRPGGPNARAGLMHAASWLRRAAGAGGPVRVVMPAPDFDRCAADMRAGMSDLHPVLRAGRVQSFMLGGVLFERGA